METCWSRASPLNHTDIVSALSSARRARPTYDERLGPAVQISDDRTVLHSCLVLPCGNADELARSSMAIGILR